MSFLKRLFGAGSQPSPINFEAEIAPEVNLFVIGDVHGCADAMESLLDKTPEGSQVVFVGDLVDRGMDSKRVLEQVYDACQNGAVCLMGNHEKMMLDFLDRPTEKGKRWLQFGGLETLMSFGVRGIGQRPSDEDLLRARDGLETAMGDTMIKWMRNLPLQYQSGNVHVVHGAADPGVAMDAQDERSLLWGHSDFGRKPRGDGQWVIHGHTVVDQAISKQGVVSIDTGAFVTNILTGVSISNGSLEYFTSK